MDWQDQDVIERLISVKIQDQAKALLSYVDAVDKGKKQIDQMDDLYLKGRLIDLYDLIYKMQQDQFLSNILYSDRIQGEERNTIVVERMETLMHRKSSMISLSCAYLPGETGVLNLLLKKGYKVRAVTSNGI